MATPTILWDDLTEDEKRAHAEKLVAASNRKQAALAALTPEQAAERERYYRKQGEHFLWLTALKRKQGRGDCSGEMAAADRHAHAAVFGPTRDVAPGATSPRTAPRTRERRERHIARSTSSSDSGEDSSDPEPPAVEPSRWADPSSWRGFLADGLTFEALQSASSAAGIRPDQRLRFFWALPEHVRAQVWASLEEPGR